MKLNDRVSLVASGGMSLSMTHYSDCNAYLVNCGQESVLIDTGTGLSGKDVIREIDRELENRLSHILITHHHADHIGGLNEIRDYYGAMVFVPECERGSVETGNEEETGLDIARRAGYYPKDYTIGPCAVDYGVKPGEKLQISDEKILVCDGSGHSLGGVCYYFTKRRMLFSGDLLMHGGYINLQNIPGADIRKYAESVTALEKLDIEEFYPGHGCFSLHDGKIHVKKAAEAFRSLGIPPNFV